MPATPLQDHRARLVKLIHVAKRELRMDEPTYRAVLLASGGAQSTAHMAAPALERVLAHLKRSGFKVRHKSASTQTAAPSRALDTRDQARKVRALWLMLHTLGVVRDPSEAALAAYVKRIAGIDALQWAGEAQLHQLIETLKKWAMRYLPAINEQLREQAMSLAKQGMLDAEPAIVLRALECKSMAFDVQWTAWSLWSLALRRDVPAQLLVDIQLLDDMPKAAGGANG